MSSLYSVLGSGHVGCGRIFLPSTRNQNWMGFLYFKEEAQMSEHLRCAWGVPFLAPYPPNTVFLQIVI